MEWIDKPTESGWYVVYRHGGYDTWRVHPAHEDMPYQFFDGIACRKGELCYGTSPDRDTFSIKGFSAGEKFLRLTEPVNA